MLKNPLYKYGPMDVKIPCSVNFGDMLLDEVLQYNRVAIVNASTHEKVVYNTIAQQGMSIALSLAQLGVRKGDVIAVASENCKEYWSTFLGVVCAGAIFTPINITYTKDELKHVLSIAKPRFIFCSPLGFKSCGATIKTLKFIEKMIVFGDQKSSNVLSFDDLAAKMVRRDDFMSMDLRSADDTVVILYSSGTTGLPKGVMLSHYNAVVLMSLFKKFGPETAQVTILYIAPWFHSMGLWSALSSLVNGRRIVFLPKFEEKLYLESIQRYKPDSLSVVPPVLVLLSKSPLLDQYDVRSVKEIFCGAAPADLRTIEEVKKRFPNLMHVSQGYGMTETTLVITRDGQDGKVKQGSVGTIMPGVIVKIVEVESRKPVGANQRGEICTKGSLLMKGYIGVDNKNVKDEEGFLKTGDVGYFDEDGYLFIVDRIKELIKYKGFQVAPAELEAELLQHPAVRDAAVVGIADKMAGEVPVAFVVKQPGSDVTGEEIQRYIAGKLSSPKHLRGGVRFVEAIPMNPSGKILRRTLKEMLRSGKSKL